jgi:hypothetical protein
MALPALKLTPNNLSTSKKIVLQSLKGCESLAMNESFLTSQVSVRGALAGLKQVALTGDCLDALFKI